MKTAVIAIACAVLPSLVFGQEIPDRTREVVHAHILPRFESLAHQSEHLANTAVADCSTASSALRSAYAKAFDAWLDTAHLLFGQPKWIIVLLLWRFGRTDAAPPQRR